MLIVGRKAPFLCRTFGLAETLTTHPAQAKILDYHVKPTTHGAGGGAKPNPVEEGGEPPGKVNSAHELIC